MLRVGAERAPERFKGRIDFVTGNAESLPLPDATFDAYTIAFGIRNVPRIDAALADAQQAALLGIEPGAPVLRRRIVTLGAVGGVTQCGLEVVRAVDFDDLHLG